MLICVSERTDQTEMKTYLEHINTHIEREYATQRNNLNVSDTEIGATIF